MRGSAGQASVLVVRPGRSLSGTLELPGDKSITHRALILGALADGTTSVEGPNPGEDGASTLACLAALGVSVRREPNRIAIQGRAMRLAEPERMLDCGNSGTTLRLLAGSLAAQPFLAILAGDASLARRPVDRVIEPLRRMGCQLWARSHDRLPPLVIKGGPLTGIHYRLPVPSAQVASCVLLAGLFARGRTTVELGPARDHTERMLPVFGVPVHRGGDSSTAEVTARGILGPAEPRGATLRVPGDFSAAAFFLAAAAATPGARVTARGVGLNPTRTGLLIALERMGAHVERTAEREEGGEPVGDVTVSGPDALQAVDLEPLAPALVPTMIDDIPAWAMAACRARGASRITGAEELRHKESDRIAVLARGLARLGVAVEEHPDGLVLHGGAVRGGRVDAAGDHRIAMAFAMLGTVARDPVIVSGAREIATSYPGFVHALRDLGGDVEVTEEDLQEA